MKASAVFLLCTFAAAAAWSTRLEDILTLMFLGADVNGNEQVSMYELQAFWYRYDANGDGNVTEEEFVTGERSFPFEYLTSEDEGRSVHRGLDLSPEGVSTVGDRLMDMEDLEVHFTTCDPSAELPNGILSMATFKAGYRYMMRGQPLGRLHMFHDFDDDSYWNRTEFDNFFVLCDRNRDLAVEEYEFVNCIVPKFTDLTTARLLFAKLDSNKDRYFTYEPDRVELYKTIDRNRDDLLSFREFLLIMGILYDEIPHPTP